MKVTIVGTGYVGLVTGVCLASIGHEVTCLDNNEKKIELLNNGKSPIYEKNLKSLMMENKTRLKYTTKQEEAYKDSDVIFIGVGTPENKDGSANLSYVNDVANQISSFISQDCIVVIKSTVPIGTNEKIEKLINESMNYKYLVRVVSNPEFLSQGNAVNDTLYAARIVIGTDDLYAQTIMEKLYEPLTKKPYDVPIVTMERKSAEMVKYASNNFLALKLSYINEIANLCEELGANIDDVTKGMGYDKRIGDKFLNAGIGYGGSCFPKDTKALYFIGKDYNMELKTISACIEVNNEQRKRLFYKINKYFDGNLNNKRIGVLGLTFKPETDDLRESIAIDNIVLLLESGAIVKGYNPIRSKKSVSAIKEKLNNKSLINNFEYYNKIDLTIKGTDAVLIFTEWDQIKKYDIENYSKMMNKPLVFDGRNCYEKNKLKNKNVEYYSIGRQ